MFYIYLHETKVKNKPTHRVLMKNCNVITWKIQFGERFLQNVHCTKIQIYLVLLNK